MFFKKKEIYINKRYLLHYFKLTIHFIFDLQKIFNINVLLTCKCTTCEEIVKQRTDINMNKITEEQLFFI